MKCDEMIWNDHELKKHGKTSVGCSILPGWVPGWDSQEMMATSWGIITQPGLNPLDQFKEGSQVFIQNSLGELLLQLFAYWEMPSSSNIMAPWRCEELGNETNDCIPTSAELGTHLIHLWLHLKKNEETPPAVLFCCKRSAKDLRVSMFSCRPWPPSGPIGTLQSLALRHPDLPQTSTNWQDSMVFPCV